MQEPEQSLSSYVESLLPKVPETLSERRALQSCVRDLVALSTVPSTWIGRSPIAIAESVRDLMESMLRPDSVYVELQDRTRGHTYVASAHVKAVASPNDPDSVLYRDVSTEPLLFDSEIELSLASLPIGLEGKLGRVAVGASRPHFPTELELLIMQVAANQIAVTLEHIELVSAHEKAEHELEAARADAEKSSKLKSEFLGMMSHELRTPLNAIGGYAQLIADGMRGPVTREQATDLERIRRSQQHLLRVIDNVLGFLKLGAGRVSYAIRDVSVDDVVSEVEDITRPLIESKQLRYRRSVPLERLFVRADPDKVQQIILNLLSNAIKFTKSGGRLGIAWIPVESEVRIRVEDSGCGIPPDRLDSVFEPFVQVDGSRTRPAGGSGLGLAISKDFAIGMGGALLVESEVGKGSTFTLVLPRP
ncbi:MAG TPA: ATP-binding protein [Gemmatimonadaceae bacterium]|nr:ATP-binding protein [Gemmatimonadaceae bacterium]